MRELDLDVASDYIAMAAELIYIKSRMLLPRVPGEPLAWLGGMAVRSAFLRAERLQGQGRRPDLLTRAVCAAPRALGIHVSR